MARDDDWDRYEEAHLRNVEAYARSRPDDPQAARMWARKQAWRDGALHAVRELMGFALIVGRRR